jgi:hypothetical protein
MKKQFLLPVFVMLGYCAVSAQTEKGKFVFGLHSFSPPTVNETNFDGFARSNAFGISFSKSKSQYRSDVSQPFKPLGNGANFFLFSLKGNGRYFIMDRLSTGLNLFYSFSTTEASSYESKTYQMMAGPDLRYYVPISKSFMYWLETDWAFGTQRQEVVSSKFNTNYLRRFSASNGVSYFPNPHISIDGGLAFIQSSARLDHSMSNAKLISKFRQRGAQVSIGFSVYL